MANITITNLPVSAPLTGAEELPVWDTATGKTLKTTVADIAALSSGGGTATTYTNATPVPTAIGGIAVGSTFNAMTIPQMLDALLYPYQLPSFSSFTFGQASPVEVGTSISGAKTFTWSSTNSTNITAASVAITDVTGASTLASGLVNDGTESLDIGAVTKTVAATHTWRISATNTQSGTFTRDTTVTWQWRRFYGESVSASLVEADVEALRVSGLSASFAGTYAFNGGGYKYLAYPAVFGTAVTFKDQSTNLDVPFDAPTTLAITNGNGIATTYKIHRSTNVLGGAINIVVS